MKTNGILSHLSTAFARIRAIVDAGPGDTSGQPTNVAGHMVFARPSSQKVSASELPATGGGNDNKKI